MPRWIAIWLSLSSLIVVWDALFVLFRPHSMTGGTLAFLWPVYDLYLAVDHSYADVDNTTVEALCTVSLLECLLVVAALAQHHRARHVWAHLLSLIVISLTGAKTVLFFLIEAFSGFEGVGHAALGPLIAVYLLPNLIWVVVPLIAVITLARRISVRLTRAPQNADL